MNDVDNEALCSNPACDELAAALAVAALGGELAPAEQGRTLAALTSCERCRRRLEAYALVAQALPLAAPDAEPSPELRARIVAAARSSPRALPAPPPAPRRPALPAWRSARTALAAALALLLAFSLWQQLQLQGLQARVAQQEAQIAQQQAQTRRNVAIVLAAFGNEDAEEGALIATELAPGASGRFFLSPGEAALAIYVKQLPTPPEGSTYQLWLAGDGRVVSGGAFSVSPEGRAWRLAQPDNPPATLERVFVTLEPQGGSAQPTGPEFLSGEL